MRSSITFTFALIPGLRAGDYLSGRLSGVVDLCAVCVQEGW